MHIHGKENPSRFATCGEHRNIPYVSLETISEFSNMPMAMTMDWLSIEIKTPTHVCDGVTYLPAHAIIQYLTTDDQPTDDQPTDDQPTTDAGRPLLDVEDALNVMTSKLGRYLDPWAEPHTPVEVRRALRTILKHDAILNTPCGTLIPADVMFSFVTTSKTPDA